MHSVGYKITYQSTIGNGEIEILNHDCNDSKVFIRCNGKTRWIRTYDLKIGRALNKTFLNIPCFTQLHNVGDVIESEK